MPRIPGYKLHPPSGLAYVRYKALFGPRPKYLGKHNSPESLARYEAALAQILEHMRQGGKLADEPRPKLGQGGIGQLVDLFLVAAESRYSKKEFDHYRTVCRMLLDGYVARRLDTFGPLTLKELRSRMVAKSWSRSHVNHQVRRVCNMFRWAVAEELADASTLANLRSVPGLRKREGGVRESRKVKSVAWEVAERVLPFLPPIIADMVRVQHLTGMRSDELTGLRPCELDRSGAVWLYRPGQHKTEHLGIEKIICIGPRAQSILRQYLPDDPREYFFTPAAAMAQRNVARRFLNDRYDAHSYQAAINHGFRRMAAAVLAPGRAKRGTGRQRREPLMPLLARAGVAHWHPHQLRHTRATVTQDSHGVEAAAAVIGDSPDAAKIYLERALKLAARVALETG